MFSDSGMEADQMMRQLSNDGDQRNQGFCIHCGGPDETRDHTPSKAFLDRPLPENLPIAPACLACNNGFAADEEYVACLLECVVAGDVDPEKIERPTVARALKENRALRETLESGRKQTEAGLVWDADMSRVSKVLMKLARGHAAFELNEPQLHDPGIFWCKPLMTLTPSEREAFESDDDGGLWPEVGSRAMHRLLIVGGQAFEEGWLVVQDGRYRYRTMQDNGLKVRIVLREYLACEVVWHRSARYSQEMRAG